MQLYRKQGVSILLYMALEIILQILLVVLYSLGISLSEWLSLMASKVPIIQQMCIFIYTYMALLVECDIL